MSGCCPATYYLSSCTRTALLRCCRGAYPLIMSSHFSFRLVVALLVLLPGLACSRAALADAQTTAESRANAVKELVLDILSYTRWPKEPPVLHLCIAAPTEYAGVLSTITRQGNGRPVQVNRYEVTDPAIAGQCHVLYLGVMDESTRLALFSRLKGHPVLSISEQNPECSSSPVFCLQPDSRSGRLRFKVNLDALALSGVRVHPAVLKLAMAARGVP